MTRTFLLIALAAAAVVWIPGAAGQQEPAATIVVTLPADAKLYFDTTLTKQGGATRTFVTPGLQPNKDYYYTLKAEAVRQGQPRSLSRNITVRAGQTTRVDFRDLDAPPAPDDEPAAEADWPRKVSKDGNTLTVYQPQVETWEGNRLTGRAAVAVENKASPRPTFGVVWLAARTDVDREQRLVTLNDIQVTRVSFPAATDKEAAYLKAIRTLVPDGARTVSLDRLLANLAVTQAEAKVEKVPLKNDVPRVFFSKTPAVLVLIDGKPALRPVQGSRLLRVINTRALVLLDQDSGKYYLHLMDRWGQAAGVEGPWSVAANPPAALEEVKKSLADSQQVDLLDDPAPDLKEDLEAGTFPTVFVSTTPAELLETEGEPDLAPIDGTRLLSVKNSPDQILLDTGTNDYYALLSGRWFRTKDLQKGPWAYVAGDKLPADFAKIPENHPKGDVLASVAGTPQAGESLIANSVPQTATIKRSEASLSPVYDGDPQFQPIEGTQLQYAVNSPTPVIQTEPGRYYAVENGVWFTAASPAGLWAVATAVPPAIYTIPPSSPIYYVTNCYVYGYTPDVVYVGYTPGYFGTCVELYGCVVYGTGWRYRPWIGRWWYGRPWTFGYGAGFRWGPAGGWGLGFAAPVGRPWWGPVGWHAGWGGAWRAGWGAGWGGRYANVHTSNIRVNNVNVYNRWNRNVIAPRRTTVAAGARGTSVVAGRQLNNVYAGSGGAVYRRAGAGWEQHTAAGGWSGVKAGAATTNTLNRQFQARQVGAVQTQSFRAAGGHAGFSGAAGGFRSAGFSGARGGGRRR
jgi:uncharacterized protein (TIGR03000 family)